jgi:hypothetical protein
MWFMRIVRTAGTALSFVAVRRRRLFDESAPSERSGEDDDIEKRMI